MNLIRVDDGVVAGGGGGWGGGLMDHPGKWNALRQWGGGGGGYYN